MKGKFVIVLAVLFLCACPANSDIYLNDGQTHNIDYEINEDVFVDYHTPEMYTTVNWLDGADSDDRLYGYENSRINILGGFIRYLISCSSSKVNISGGRMGGYSGFVESYHSSQMDISGGDIMGLISSDSSRMNISGGSIEGLWHIRDQSIMQIFGSDFAINGQPVGYGELTSIFGGSAWDEPPRHLTGTLLNGDFIDNVFYIGNEAKIILIPEPATLLLLGLGGILLRKRQY